MSRPDQAADGPAIPAVFDLAAPLPAGRLAVEASAGTGKTFALATLAARYVAERGIPVGSVLVVTFTRAAAAEVKDRVRRRLVEFASALSSTQEPEDRLLSALWRTDRQLRLGRVRRALTDFDSATITTIHGFAQQVLATAGSSVPTDPEAVLFDDAGRAALQAATDILVAESASPGADIDDLPGLEELYQAVKLAMDNPAALLVPSADPRESSPKAARLRRLVDRVIREVDRRRRAAGTLGFDDLLTRLKEALEGEAGPPLRHLLRSRYSVALIDEFQDTDPVQWSIFDAVFGADPTGDDPRSVLVLVGDPKQAIYAFRGANVHTYLQAVHGDGIARSSLTVNWRSDGRVLRATDLLLSGVTFGDSRIGFRPVVAAESNLSSSARRVDGSELPGLSIRLTDGPNVARQTKSPGVALDAPGTRSVFAETAAYIKELLETVDIPDPGGNGRRRRLRPDDIAVLVSANAEAAVARRALSDLGIAAVVARGENVLRSPAAAQWHLLLAATARPQDPRRARAYALSWFAGWQADRVADGDGHELVSVQEKLHDWAEYLSAHGTAPFVGRVLSETAVAARVLARADGDRDMTDLDHVGELLVHAGGTPTTPVALLGAFEALDADYSSSDAEADVAARRVESDADAVAVMTTFVAKGLEFPVVCCPTLWKPNGVKVDANVWWDETSGRRVIDVASREKWGTVAEHSRRRELAEREALGVNLRVLYVALTRARHHTALWWLPVAKAGTTGLGRVLFARDGDGRIDPTAFEEPTRPFSGGEAIAKLAPLVARSGGCVEVVSVDDPGSGGTRWAGNAKAARGVLSVSELRRRPDRTARRWSFTAITASRADAQRRGGPPEGLSRLGVAVPDDLALFATTGGYDEGFDDEAVRFDSAVPGDESTPLPLGGFAGSAEFGTLVHETLERVDFTAEDLAAEVDRVLVDRLRRSPVEVDRARLGEGLVSVLSTPLGPLFEGSALRGIGRADRIDEMTFDLTLGRAGVAATDADLGALIADHLGEGDPLRDWAAKLREGPFSALLAGHLTGSIDLVARTRSAQGFERYVVCDYKTNRLAPPSRQAQPGDFAPQRLGLAMAEHDYPLQGLLYAVALHRYLRWRLDGYDPSAHLGGVAYLFVRGMQGPDTPVHGGTPNGLFVWRPSPDLIVAVSDLLDGSHAPLRRPR